MKERPILFSAPMVRAILDGRKTQTRRILKPQPHIEMAQCSSTGTVDDVWFWKGKQDRFPKGKDCPYGKPGDTLWVRETWRVDGLDRNGALLHGKDVCREDGASFYADCVRDPSLAGGPWIPSIHMPRWASRITLEVVSVRVERLNDIGEEDARAEGADVMMQARDGCWVVCGPRLGSYREGYRWLWESINGAGSWAANPWVWVVEFKRIA